MPLTKAGRKIMRAFKSEYGKKRGESIFYATANQRKGGKGKIGGKKVH